MHQVIEHWLIREADIAQKNFAPHLEIIRLFASNFEAIESTGSFIEDFH